MEEKGLQHKVDFPHTVSHELFMRRAMELALNGTGNVSPNPLVGCVIAHEGKIIGEGWHQKYGGNHAEVNAIEDVYNKELLRESTLYVNLEPCSHTGKTPPCADMILGQGIREVVIANKDINPLVAGAGIRKLRDAGISVITGILKSEGLDLNKRFFTYIEKKRPHIILKWAETSDGFIARKNNDSKWISDDYSRQLVHKWRAEEDAVLVASGTAWYDNPSLNVRDWTGRNPVRIVIDRYLKLGPNQHVFDRKQKTICYNLQKEDSDENLRYIRLENKNFLESMVQSLHQQKIQSVIVEGGGQLLNSFIKANLWDEARIFVSPERFEQGVPAPYIRGATREQRKLDKDWLKILVPAFQDISLKV